MLSEKILDSLLFSKNILSQLSELHEFIVKEDIWQLKPLHESFFRSKITSYKISSCNFRELCILSKNHLIKADYVLVDFNNEPPPYLKFITERDNGIPIYLFEENKNIPIDLKNILRSEESVNYKPYFHPYRIYGINCLLKKINPTSIYPYNPLSGNNLKDICKWMEKVSITCIENPDIWKEINFYNVLIDFCIISRVVSSRIISGKVSFPQGQYTRIIELQDKLKNIYEILSLDIIKLIHQQLVREAQFEDDNSSIHLLLRMTNYEERLLLKGKLGLSMLFLEMAEAIRRNAELYFDVKMDEEFKVSNEYVEEFMKQNFGSTRILDNSVIKNEFIRHVGLDYTLRAKIYVEGITEYGFLEEVFSEIHSVQLIHLEGQFVEGKKKGLAFRDSLLEDKRLHIFSFVFIDSDRKDNIRVLEQSVKNNEFFGMFLKSDPDFECGNFSAKELYLAFCNYNSIIENPIFAIKQSEVESGKGFFKVVSEMHPEQRLSKSKEWGKALFSFMKENELERKYLIEFIQKIFTSLSPSCSYERHIQLYQVDPKTGLLTDRK